MKPLFICRSISAYTEMPELRDNGKRRYDAWVDWLPLGVLPCLALLFRDRLPSWVFMWAVAFALFLGCKWLTWRRALKTTRAADLFRAICYFFFWPGMDPVPFLSPALPDGRYQITLGGSVLKIAVGAALLFGAARLASGSHTLWVGWLGMFGVILFLHFGTFELLAAGMSKAGFVVEPVMRAPIRARSLGEFWGRRWNTAFNDLVHELAFRPLVRFFHKHSRKAVALATLSVFVISGLVHELVISLPARGGYGLPTAYFILQGLGVLLERSRFGRRIGLGRGLRGWLFTAVLAAGPAFWLFHPPFVRNVILPMLRTLGGY